MIGTHLQTAGGISSVVLGYQKGGLFDRVDSIYVATHREGSIFRKVSIAVSSFCRIVYLLMTSSPVLHAHVAARGSFWRKAFMCLAAELLRRPYIFHVHGSGFMSFVDHECGPIAKQVVRHTLKRAAVVLALSEQWRQDLQRICPTAKIEVLHNGVEIPDARAWIQRASAPPGILFLGRLGNRKGSFDLVRAFAAIATQFPSTQLICAGDGAIEETRALAHELGVGSRVKCLGWLGPNRIAQQLAHATVFTLPSYAEGLPMALLEAMAWALPVVTTPVGGIADVVNHGENGFLVDPGDPERLSQLLADLLVNESLRREMGARARQTIEQDYSREASIATLQNIYARFGVSAS